MKHHLSEQDLRAYRERVLDPTDLLDVDDHLTVCPECQARLSKPPETSIRQIQSQLRPAHLQYEQIAAYADGALRDPDALEHLAECRTCKREAEELRSFALEVRPGILRTPWWSWLLGWQGAVAAIAVAAVLVLAIDLRPRPKPTLNPSAPRTQTAVVKQTPEEYRTLVASTVAAGRITLPARIAALSGGEHQLLGSVESAPKFSLVDPAGTAVASDRPDFHWTPLPGAASYRVAVYDAAFNPVLLSPPVTETSWTANKPLPAGRVYSWQVKASVGGRQVLAPKPPAPEAKFMILSPGDIQSLNDLRAKFPEAHLTLAVVYGRAGALADARAELEMAMADPATAGDARKLLASLHR